VRASTRPSLAISTLSPLHLDLHEGKNAWIVCPDEGCGSWVEVHRGVVQVHRRSGVRCCGSKRHVEFDLSPAQHARRYAAARHALVPARRTVVHTAMPYLSFGERRAAVEAAWTREIARAPVAPAVHQIAAHRALAAA
jgi:hypothetical protein